MASEEERGVGAGAWQLSLPLLMRNREANDVSETVKNKDMLTEDEPRSTLVDSRSSFSHVASQVPLCEVGQSLVGRHGSRPTNFSYSQPVLVDGQSYCSYEEEMAKLDDINRQLNEIKESLLETTIRSHLLNIDLVTQFNPDTVEALNKTVEECKACIERFEEKEN
jgi:hypothetical protein